MDYYTKIKDELINNEVYKRVKDYSKNRSDLNTYYNVGKLLVEAQGGEKRAKYGNGLIKDFSKRLTNEVDRKYGERNLRNMRQFYIMFKDEIWHSKNAKLLTWSHYKELLRLNSKNEIDYYIRICAKQNLSYRELHDKINNKEYERLDDNTKLKLINNDKEKVEDFITNPILIKNKYGKEKISEKMLKQLILEDMKNFLLELGTGFTFIADEYPIKLGDRYNYIDLLLYNITYKCYVVELKVTELKKEHIGQIETYMNYIDKNIKTINENDTIGIIICKKDNKFIMEYVINNNIFDREYELV